ncbi:MAG: hypothetical protein J7L86_04530 [Candidatus Marinimicrobia bacterium]|nr:hypothetical protein [Candidatus Neomarinimicrobiota bacterium]
MAKSTLEYKYLINLTGVTTGVSHYVKSALFLMVSAGISRKDISRISLIWKTSQLRRFERPQTMLMVVAISTYLLYTEPRSLHQQLLAKNQIKTVAKMNV